MNITEAKQHLEDAYHSLQKAKEALKVEPHALNDMIVARVFSATRALESALVTTELTIGKVERL